MLACSCSACSYISKGSAWRNGVLMIKVVFLIYSNQCIASFQPFCCQCFLVQLEPLIFEWLRSPFLSEELPSSNSNVFAKHFPSETPPRWWSGRTCFPMVESCVSDSGRTARFPFRCSPVHMGLVLFLLWSWARWGFALWTEVAGLKSEREAGIWWVSTPAMGCLSPQLASPEPLGLLVSVHLPPSVLPVTDHTIV